MQVLLTANFKNGLFCNGLTQNIVFLAELINSIGFHAIIAINHEEEEGRDIPKDIDLIYEKDLDSLDDVTAIIESGWTLHPHDAAKIKSNNPSAKHIHIHYGNRMMADIEQCRRDTIGISRAPVDEVWISPHYEISVPYFQTFYKNPNVFIAPYIWDDKYISIHEEIFGRAGLSPRYEKDKPFRFCVLEPNLNMTKNCIPSIMIFEELFHRDPSSFENLTVYCSQSIKDKRYFVNLINQLDIFKEGKIGFESRENLCKIFSNNSNACVSHHLMNGLNYTYLECLYFGIPLVHNSTYIEDAGFYYPGYDIHSGADQVAKAISTYDENYDMHIKKNKEILFRYSPNNESVKMEYKRMIER